MVNSPFPSYVGFSVKTPDNLGWFKLLPEEERLISPRAVAKRKDEFILGRAACREALRMAGLENPPPILKGPSNEPVWPKGYIGALSHATGIAICAVCPAAYAVGIGVDVEDLGGFVTRDVMSMVCGESEMAWVDGDQMRFRMLFSAKESAFKALYPLVHTHLDFKDSTLTWNEHNSAFTVCLTRSLGDFDKGCTLLVGVQLTEHFVFSYILIPPI